jgi:MOSC domain-containing protein YiiM
MAVLAYSADHYPAWRAELSWPELPLGGFGENLSVSGTTERLACVGDVWRAGTALLQISSPRNPCVKISTFWRRADLLDRVRGTGRIGWYLRVLEEGELEAGIAVALVARPHEAWPISRVWDVMTRRREEPEAARDLAGVAALSGRWKARLRGEPARL